jgi:hypothetical protein
MSGPVFIRYRATEAGLAVSRISGSVGGDLRLAAVAMGQQFLLRHDLLAAFLEMVLKKRVSTMASTGQASSQNPQKMHLKRSMS